mmetsp:Transcript_20007/g.48554  ORF Transcript_20007/g.48554 Transcript_20007/m.48554 type:complete len:85 (-) Transcript_20007:880-1134(-)
MRRGPHTRWSTARTNMNSRSQCNDNELQTLKWTNNAHEQHTRMQWTDMRTDRQIDRLPTRLTGNQANQHTLSPHAYSQGGTLRK